MTGEHLEQYDKQSFTFSFAFPSFQLFNKNMLFFYPLDDIHPEDGGLAVTWE
jgi:hypothetical protein